MNRWLPAAAAALLAPVALSQTTVFVDASATGANDGSSWADAFTDLQSALALSNVDVWVAAGIYHPGPSGATAATFVLKDGVALYGGFSGTETQLSQRDPALFVTRLSGDLDDDDVYGAGIWYKGWNVNGPNSQHVVTASGVGPTAVLDGFWIQEGRVAFQQGAGMQCLNASPTIANCTFWRNITSWSSGSGLVVSGGNPTIANCTFLENFADRTYGGGLAIVGVSAPTVTDCLFQANHGRADSSTETRGVGLYFGSSLPVTISRCTFSGQDYDTVFVGQGVGYGGGLYSFAPAKLTVDSCTFDSNSAIGGGIYAIADVDVVASTFRSNVGGGFTTTRTAAVSGSVFFANSSGGFINNAFQGQTSTVTNSVFALNTSTEGAGILTVPNPFNPANTPLTVVRNTILWGNTATQPGLPPSEVQIKGNDDIAFSCVQDLFDPVPGEDPVIPSNVPGSIEGDPLFVDLAGGDLRLTSDSPCIDSGDDASVPAGLTTDLDGNPRIQGAAVDMGAYEFGGTPTGPFAYCTAKMDSLQCVPVIGWSGVASLSTQAPFDIEALELIHHKNGLLFYGYGPASLPFLGGTLCVQPPLRRTGVQNSGGTNDCTGALHFDFNAHLQSGVDPFLTQGADVRAQYWYRDPGDPAGSGLSNAVGFTIQP